MKYSLIYLWEATPYKMADHLLSVGQQVILESTYNCVVYSLNYSTALCQKLTQIHIHHLMNIKNLHDIIVYPRHSLSYIVVMNKNQRHMFIFFGLPKFLIETPINYHRWIWNNPKQTNWILLPNLKNDPQYYFPLHFKKFTYIREQEIDPLRLDNKNHYIHPDVQFRLYVDTHYPITVYDSHGLVVLGQIFQNYTYIELSPILNIAETYYVSCNDVITRKTQPIVRIFIGIYNNNTFLFSDQMIFRIAPIILTPNCLGSKMIYLTSVHGIQNNESFIKNVTNILEHEKHKYTIVENKQISMFHRWIQDILKFCYVTDGNKLSYIILKGPRFATHSIKKGDMSYIFDYFNGYPLYDFYIESAKNLDAMGNVQVIPPIYPNYPFGRIIYGVSTDEKQENISYNLLDLLESQEIQKPVTIDTGWLTVGHVDEIISFIPDPKHKYGFRILIASTRCFYQLITKLDSETVIFDDTNNYYIFHKPTSDVKKRFAQKYDDINTKCIYKTPLKVKDLLNWSEMIANNQEYQKKLDHNRKILMNELNLTKNDFLEVPICYWPKSLSPKAKSILPNMINNLYTDHFMLVPKPFGPIIDQIDIFEQYFASLIPTDIRIYFVQNWDAYYLLDGDINCGTNVRRKPFKVPWWSHKPNNSYNI